MLDKILLIVIPYLSVLVALGLTLNFFRTKEFSLSKLSNDYQETRPYFDGAFPWHFGLMAMFLGHAIMFICPTTFLNIVESPVRLYIIEGIGLIITILTAFSLVLAVRNVFSQKIKGSIVDKTGIVLLALTAINGLYIAVNYRWVTSWYTSLVVPFLRSLFTFKPNLELVASLPLLVKVQIALTFIILILIPLTRFLRIAFLFLAYPRQASTVACGGKGCSIKAFAQNNKSLLKKLALPVGIIVGGIIFSIIVVKARGIGFTEGYAPTQPIKFSHKTHAGENKIQCVYCHYGAQSSRHAGVPPTELCMNCHTNVKKDSPEIKKLVEALDSGKPIAWNKVNHFPDFAYFNHSQHVMVGKVACQKCHGEVQTMVVLKQEKALAMGWCIACHRENQIAAPKDHKTSAGGDCARCHY